MAIVGISGSPIINGNVDRLTRAILEESGKETKCINLTKLNFGACRGCAHNCATTAMCGVKDELHPHLADVRDAEALVLGTPIHHGTMTAWMYSFFSRTWCFMHENKTLRNKPAVLVSVGIDEVPKGEVYRSSTVQEHQLNVLGQMHFVSLIPPCFKCGKGDTCQWGGLWRMVGRDPEALKAFEITPDKFRRWEDDEQMVAEVKRYGKILSEL